MVLALFLTEARTHVYASLFWLLIVGRLPPSAMAGSRRTATDCHDPGQCCRRSHPAFGNYAYRYFVSTDESCSIARASRRLLGYL
jgi:hypothetical protein